jgi:hypothetical protein
VPPQAVRPRKAFAAEGAEQVLLGVHHDGVLESI